MQTNCRRFKGTRVTDRIKNTQKKYRLNHEIFMEDLKRKQLDFNMRLQSKCDFLDILNEPKEEAKPKV